MCQSVKSSFATCESVCYFVVQLLLVPDVLHLSGLDIREMEEEKGLLMAKR